MTGEPVWRDDRRCGNTACGQLLGPQYGQGRVREYCGDRCRQAAWRRRQDPLAAWLRAGQPR